MFYSDFIDLYENAWKSVAIKNGNSPKSLLTNQEEYIKSKAQIDLIRETQLCQI